MSADPIQPGPHRPAPPRGAASRSFLLRATSYPQHYTWYVFLSSLDLLFTWFILHSAGREENIIADWIIRRYDLAGLIAYKFVLVALVVLVCEIVGRRDRATGRKLARWMIVLGGFPVVVGAAHILYIALRGGAG